MTTYGWNEWHHGYSAGALLRLVAFALRECIDDKALAREPNDCFRTLAEAVEMRAGTLHWSAYGVVSELCSAILFTLRTLYGSGRIHPIADHLLCSLAAEQPDWFETMKLRKHWLALVKEVENALEMEVRDE